MRGRSNAASAGVPNAAAALGWRRRRIAGRMQLDFGPGNVLEIVIEGTCVTEVVTAFGEKGVSAEDVAARACDEAERYMSAGVPVGIHLADQLLIPMALAGGGVFRTCEATAHTVTNADVIRRFIDIPIAFDNAADGTCRVIVGSTPGQTL